MEDVHAFLKSLDLEQYAEAFERHGLDDMDLLEMLPEVEVDKAVKKALSDVDKIGHEMKIKNGLRIRKLTKEERPFVHHFTVESPDPVVDAVDYPGKLKSLLIPNAFSAQNKFFNTVLKNICQTADFNEVTVDTVYDYVVGQRYHRWVINEKVDAVMQKLQTMKSGVGADCKLANVSKYVECEQSSLNVDAIRKMENTVAEMERCVKRIQDPLCELRTFRGQLYDKNMNFKKNWKVSELDYYVSMINKFEEYETETRKMKEVILTKLRMLRARYHDHTIERTQDKQVEQRKKYNVKTAEKRLSDRCHSRALELVKLLNIDNDDDIEKLDNVKKLDDRAFRNIKMKKINDGVQLTPLFHKKGMELLIQLNVFEGEALDDAKRYVSRLSEKAEKTRLTSEATKASKAAKRPKVGNTITSYLKKQ